MATARADDQESVFLAQSAGGISATLPNPSTRLSRLFPVGDGVFLIAVGVESAVIMQAIHQLEWNFLVLSILGMAAAMVVQMVLAFAVSPVLGSIETMAPSMVVAMVVPMLLDVGEIAGWMISRTNAAIIGATLAVLYFLYLQWYQAEYRRQLARIWITGAGAR